MKQGGQGGARVLGKKRGTEIERRGTSWSSESMTATVGFRQIRRAIPSSSVCFERRAKGRGERTLGAIYSRLQIAGGARVWPDLIGGL
jgi:hypothetical protein